MKTMKWLLRREYWEHKGAFFWTPAVIALVMLVFVGGAIVYGIAQGHMNGIVIGGHHTHTVGAGDSLRLMPPETRAEMAAAAATHYLGFAAPLFMALPIVVFFYCLGALYDERRDRSILFWKSLPVSDQMSVLSKVGTAVVVAPVITAAIGTAASLVALLAGVIVSAVNGVNLFNALILTPNLYLSPLYLLGLLPVYILWALPTVGWLLLVSSWARSKVFLWAIGTPLIAAMLVKWFSVMVERFTDSVVDVHWFMVDVIGRGLGGLIPGVWLPFTNAQLEQMGSQAHGANLPGIFTQSWLSLATPGVWGGVIAGVLMILAAIRLRRWRDEG